MLLTPQHRLFVAALLTALAAVTAIQLALRAPMLDLLLVSDNGSGLLVAKIGPGSANRQQLSPGARVTEIGGVEVGSGLRIEEPDQLGSWDEYNGFLEAMEKLSGGLSDHRIEARVDGRSVMLTARQRLITDLPPMFWFQISVGVLAFLIAAGVYAFRPTAPGAAHFALAGLAIMISVAAASVYSTRELILSGELIRQLSRVNEFGAVFFTGALVALMGEYPKTIITRVPLAIVSYSGALLIWVGFALQRYPEPGTVYAGILLFFSATFLLAFLQWRRTIGSPVERAALKWYLLSIYIGTGLFATVILFPVAMGTEPVASQGMMFVVFLFMFVGIAFGITRYRLFELDRWWLAAWSWFLGGVLVVAIDLLLLSVLGLNQGTSLALSLALVGWVWFPARQWILARLRRESSDSSRLVHRLVRILFGAETPGRLAEMWQKHLMDEWGALELQVREGKLDHPYVGEDAQMMAVPGLLGDKHLVLLHPQRGNRLFNRRDLDDATLLHTLACQARDGLLARQKALEEKQRIFGDLHDDVGSKLLSLLYRAQDEDSGELARSALQDLRDVVSQPDEGELSLTDALADWRAEAQERLDLSGIRLEWRQSPVERMLPVFHLRHLGRVLREALNNVIKHSGATKVSIEISLEDEILHLAIADNGIGGEPGVWKEGRGLSSIRHRLNKLGGQGRWRQNDGGGCMLELSLPVGGLTE